MSRRRAAGALAPSRPRPPSPRHTLPVSKPATRVLVVSGPNLDRLGKREPHIYGKTTLAEVHAGLAERAGAFGVSVDCRQSNHEGELVTWVNSAAEEGFAGILLNAGAYTHTSYALYDAIKASGLPVIEVHVSNPEARESFRHVSVIAGACLAKVAGFGAGSYQLALEGLIRRLNGD